MRIRLYVAGILSVTIGAFDLILAMKLVFHGEHAPWPVWPIGCLCVGLGTVLMASAVRGEAE